MSNTTILLDPKRHDRPYPDARSREVMEKTIEFFETKGKARLKADYHDRGWYADFLEFVERERIFATLCTPAGFGQDDTRWDTWRNCEFAEILAFYGLQYWYTWQVSVLGLGPLWMSDNDAIKQRTAAALDDGGIFAFGLSEKEHGADIYSTETTLTPAEGGGYTARGGKYYIGNANEAELVSVLGKMSDSGDFVFFAVSPRHEEYELVKNVIANQSYVAEFRLHDYPVAEEDILAKGRDAWNAALNTVNIGKYNLGWGSIGMCTHAMYEAITHASRRRLYGMAVTDFPHVRRLFVDAYARLVAMKLFALRAGDYMRVASADDRRYLLFNPMVKMKVTTQGEEVINLMWDVIAAKGFEKDTYFEQAAIDIRALPKLEGTVHVNIALIVKFIVNYFFAPAEYEDVPRQDHGRNDDFLFDQGDTRGLSKIRFHDYRKAYAAFDLPNVNRFEEQIEGFKALLMSSSPTEAQRKDTDFLMSVGEMFALVVYGQLILENASIYGIDDATVDRIFDFMVRDFSKYALELSQKAGTSDAQAQGCIGLIRRPVANSQTYESVWATVLGLSGTYEMNP